MRRPGMAHVRDASWAARVRIGHGLRAPRGRTATVGACGSESSTPSPTAPSPATRPGSAPGPDAFPDDDRLQQVAVEVNLSETAFAHPLPEGGEADWALRWFTPATEVGMCGHATLATAHVLHTTGAAKGTVRFATRSGVLVATPGDGRRDHPGLPDRPAHRGRRAPTGWPDALGARAAAALRHRPAHRRPAGGAGRRGDRARAGPGPPGARPTRSAASSPPRRAEDPAGGYDFVSRVLLPRRRHRRGPGDRQRAHRARPVLVRSGSAVPHLTGLQASARTGLRPHRAARRPHPADRHARSPSSTANCWSERPFLRTRARRHGADRPPAPPARHGVGSQPTFPASSAYPTNAPMSSSACAATSGPTRPQRR